MLLQRKRIFSGTGQGGLFGSVRMLLQRKHTIMRWKDLSVQLAGMALSITVVRNEAMHAQGRF